MLEFRSDEYIAPSGPPRIAALRSRLDIRRRIIFNVASSKGFPNTSIGLRPLNDRGNTAAASHWFSNVA